MCCNQKKKNHKKKKNLSSLEITKAMCIYILTYIAKVCNKGQNKTKQRKCIDVRQTIMEAYKKT